MQNQDRENLGKDPEAGGAEAAQGADSQNNFAEGPEEGAEFGVEPPIIIQGGGTPQN
jgi:hypothetical protein